MATFLWPFSRNPTSFNRLAIFQVGSSGLGHAIAGVEGVYDRHSYRDEKADALRRLAALICTIVHPPTANVRPIRGAARTLRPTAYPPKNGLQTNWRSVGAPLRRAITTDLCGHCCTAVRMTCRSPNGFPKWSSNRRKTYLSMAVLDRGSMAIGARPGRPSRSTRPRARLATHHLQARQRRGRVQVSELAAFYGYGKPTPGGGPHTTWHHFGRGASFGGAICLARGGSAM